MRIPGLATITLAGLAILGCDRSDKPAVRRSSETQEPLGAPHDLVEAAKPVESDPPDIPRISETDGLLRSSRELVEAVKAVPDIIRETPALVRSIHSSLRELHVYVAENDYEKARATAAAIDRVMKSRTFSWYVQILTKEEAEGVPAALSLIEELRKSENISATEKDALNHFAGFLHQKGELKSVDVIFLVSAAALESKYGKGAGTLLLALQYPLRPKDSSSAILEAYLKGEFPGEGDKGDPLPAGNAAETR